MAKRNQEKMIRKFYAEVDRSEGGFYCRGRNLAFELPGARELRTKKNDYLAEVWDDLGNVFVLTAEGRRLQLIGSEYNGA